MRKGSWVALVVLGVALGCSTATRERLTAFFFEVPPPATPATDAEPTPTPPPGAVKPSPPRFVSVHRPFLQHECRSCHDASQRMQVRTDLADSCRGCHTRYFGPDVGHAPVANGQCRDCHEMHRSEHPSLLKQPVLKTCIECHEEPADLSQEAHGKPNVDKCTSCHDPHFGTGVLLRSAQPSQK